jgi:hypothetical protein
MIIHNTGHPGIGFWRSVGDGGEIYGTLLWGNGIYDTSIGGTTRGSAIYAQNEVGTRYIKDIISFRNFTTGGKAYTEGGWANGFHFEGNISFDNDQWNLLANGGSNGQRRLNFINNYTYRRPGDTTENIRLGYSGDHYDIVVQNNYLVGSQTTTGEGILFTRSFATVDVTNNTIIGDSLLGNWKATSGGGDSITWNNNIYYGGSSQPFEVSGTRYNFSDWKTTTGFDANSTYSSSKPSQAKVVVRPNVYESGRAHIIVYNWSFAGSIAVDVSNILSNGQSYSVYDAQNYFGDPVASGTYNGRAINFPMNLTNVSPLVGNVTHINNEHTPSEFNVFVLVGGSVTSATPTPSLISASASVSAGGLYNPTVKLTQTATGETFVNASGETIEETKIEFSGKAVAGAKIRIEIRSGDGKIIPGVTTADGNGNWSFTPPPNLDPGEYTATFIAKDKKGNKGTTTLNFIVDETGKAKITQSTQETGETVEETIETNILQIIVGFVKDLISRF